MFWNEWQIQYFVQNSFYNISLEKKIYHCNHYPNTFFTGFFFFKINSRVKEKEQPNEWTMQLIYAKFNAILLRLEFQVYRLHIIDLQNMIQVQGHDTTVDHQDHLCQVVSLISIIAGTNCCP